MKTMATAMAVLAAATLGWAGDSRDDAARRLETQKVTVEEARQSRRGLGQSGRRGP